MNSLTFDTEKYFLGKLCRNNHEWENTGQSLHYVKKSSGGCVACKRQRRKDRYYKDHEKSKLLQKEKAKRFIAKNPELHRKYARESRKKAYADPTKRQRMLEQDKNYKQSHKEAIRERVRKYLQTERGKFLKKEASKRYILKNKGKRLAYFRIWNKTEKGRMRSLLGSERRRARKLQAHSSGYNGFQLAEHWLLFNNQCAYCGTKATTNDHVLPLSKGGADVLGNIVPACLSCNSSKNASNVKDWFTRQDFFCKKRWQKIQKLIGLEVCDGQIPLF